MSNKWIEMSERSDVIDYLIKNKQTKFSMPTFEGKEVALSGGALIANLLLLKPLYSRGYLPQAFGLFTGDIPFTDSVRRKMQNTAYFHPQVSQTTVDVRRAISSEFFYATDALSNVLTMLIPEGFTSLSMIQIAYTMEDPAVKEILAFDAHRYLEDSLKTLELKIEEHNKKIVTELKELKDNNCFRQFLLTSCFNEGQFFQSTCLGGPRTDIDDTAVTRPIFGNYINGLDGNIEYMIESFSARKSEDYNKDHMGDASYTKRKINLMASALTEIHPGACETEATLNNVIITPRVANSYIGRNIRDDYGDIVTLLPSNIRNYINKPISLYSPITCQHTDGCCHRCGGMILETMPPDTNIGQAATEQIMNPLQQSILSSKHLVKTLIQLFFFPKPLDEFFSIRDGSIYLEEPGFIGTSVNEIRIGVPTEGVQNISELNEFHGEDIPGSYYSAIPSVAVAHDETGEIFVPLTDVIVDGKIIPHFTAEFLRYLKHNKSSIVYNGYMMWFKVDGFDRTQPIMEFDYVSESAYVFIQKIEQFFAKDTGLPSYTSATKAVTDLLRLLSHRIFCSSTHVELLIKAAMVTSDTDLSIPRVYDAESVKFCKMPQINTYRNIANEAAYERWADYTHDPKSYVYPTKSGLFDGFLGTDDFQHPEEFANNPNLARY